MSDYDMWEVGQIRRDLSSLRDSSFVRQNAVDSRIGLLLRRTSNLELRLGELEQHIRDLEARLGQEGGDDDDIDCPI